MPERSSVRNCLCHTWAAHSALKNTHGKSGACPRPSVEGERHEATPVLRCLNYGGICDSAKTGTKLIAIPWDGRLGPHGGVYGKGNQPTGTNPPANY
jgi:hypothetical protein